MLRRFLVFVLAVLQVVTPLEYAFAGTVPTKESGYVVDPQVAERNSWEFVKQYPQPPPDLLAQADTGIGSYTNPLGTTNAPFNGSNPYVGGGVFNQRSGEPPLGFYADLQTTLVPQYARGSGTPTFTRALSAAQIDHEGKINWALSGEARFNGARRVQNLVTASEDLTNGIIASSNVTVTATTVAFTAANNSYYFKGSSSLAANVTIRLRFTVSSSVNRTVFFRMNHTVGAETTSANIAVTSTPQVLSLIQTFASAGSAQFNVDNRAAAGASDTSTTGVLTITNVQFENVTGQTNQNPSEYVSVGAPFSSFGKDVELVANGAFAADVSSWTVHAGDTFVWNSSGSATITASGAGFGYVYQAITTKVGKTYLVTATTTVSGSHYIQVGTTAGAFDLLNYSPSGSAGVPTTYYQSFVATGTTSYVKVQTSGVAGSQVALNAFSTKEVQLPANVDGVKYFSTLNANTVTSNVVTEATGAPINSSTAKWASLPGNAAVGNDFTTASAPANTFSGDIDLRFVGVDSWQGTGNYDAYIVKDNGAGNATEYAFLRSGAVGGKLWFATRVGGSAKTATPDATVPFASGTLGAVRVTHETATGNVKFYYSLDFGATWIQLGTTQSITAGVRLTSTNTLRIGNYASPGGNQWAGRVYRAQIYNGINGTLAVDFNPNDSTNAQTWTSSTTGEVWTTNGNARVYGNTHATYGIPAYWDASGPYGYLAEGSRANAILQSDLFTTSWGVTTAELTVTANVAVSPQGITNAASAVESAATSEHYRGQVITTTAVPWTFSMWAKLYGTTRPYFRIRVDDGTNNNAVQANFNINTQSVATGPSVVGTYASATSSVVVYPNGWTRCILTVTPSASASTRFLLYTMDSDYATNVFTGNTSHAGDTSAGLYWSGAVAEIGSFASTYIPTTTAAVTRPADVLTYPTSGNILGTSGTAYAEVVRANESAGTDQGIIGSGVSSVPMTKRSTTLSMFDGAYRNYGTFTPDVLHKVSVSWGGSTSAGAVDGSVTAGSFDGDMNLTSALEIGHYQAGAVPLFGTIRNVRIWLDAMGVQPLKVKTSFLDQQPGYTPWLVAHAANDEFFCRAANS